MGFFPGITVAALPWSDANPWMGLSAATARIFRRDYSDEMMTTNKVHPREKNLLFRFRRSLLNRSV
jgi:hypothetical protein